MNLADVELELDNSSFSPPSSNEYEVNLAAKELELDELENSSFSPPSSHEYGMNVADKELELGELENSSIEPPSSQEYGMNSSVRIGLDVEAVALQTLPASHPFP